MRSDNLSSCPISTCANLYVNDNVHACALSPDAHDRGTVAYDSGNVVRHATHTAHDTGAAYPTPITRYLGVGDGCVCDGPQGTFSAQVQLGRYVLRLYHDYIDAYPES